MKVPNNPWALMAALRKLDPAIQKNESDWVFTKLQTTHKVTIHGDNIVLAVHHEGQNHLRIKKG